jgi:2-phosphoglycerate kinase
MPTDLAPDPRIVVHDRTGARLPYSRGIMATSLLATGLPTEEAYQLASHIQARLLQHDRSDVDAHELVEIAQSALDEHASTPGVSQRWMAWRSAKRSGRPIIVVLGGAPGVGKSTIASRLAIRLDVTRVITTDAIREVLRLVVPAIVLPELHSSTYELIDNTTVGPPQALDFSRFDRQCESVGHAAAAVAARLASENRSMVLEGVHLLPGQLRKDLEHHPANPIVIERLITIEHGAQHGQNLTARSATEPLRDGARHLDRFDIIRSIHDHLTSCAVSAEVRTVDAYAAHELTQEIVDEIAALAAAGTT